MNPNIETALVEGIALGRQERSTAPTGFYASSLGQCFRKQILERANVPPTNLPDVRSQFKMAIGTTLGKWVQERLTASGYLVPEWTEKRVVYRSVSGKVDGYTEAIPGGAVVEIKTCDDDAITRYKEMPDHYKWQGLWYLLATGVPNLVILMVGKNQGLTKHQVLTLGEDWRETLEKHISVLETFWQMYVNHGAVPDHSHSFKWEDRYCPYKDDDLQAMANHKEGMDGTTG